MKNPKVVAYSVIALCFLVLTFLVDWIFIVPAAILMFLNQKELMKGKIKKKKL
jgi:hypothetical protein|tara:strand:- start:509 stop:667 length:159 start_codon:yes stop_codon:yes gene_type:complete